MCSGTENAEGQFSEVGFGFENLNPPENSSEEVAEAGNHFKELIFDPVTKADTTNWIQEVAGNVLSSYRENVVQENPEDEPKQQECSEQNQMELR